MPAPRLSTTVNRIAVGALLGAVVGVLVGLLLRALGVLENPFYVMSIGIAVGACTGIVPRPRDAAPSGAESDGAGPAR